MGFSNLRGQGVVKVRQGNKMALASIKRCEELDEAGKYFTLEHPYRSFIWYYGIGWQTKCPHGSFQQLLLRGPASQMDGCAHNNVGIYEALHKP